MDELEQIITQSAAGKSNAEIARELGVSYNRIVYVLKKKTSKLVPVVAAKKLEDCTVSELLGLIENYTNAADKVRTAIVDRISIEENNLARLKEQAACCVKPMIPDDFEPADDSHAV
jgi:orotate phosphoribosyltransferase-like protein